MWWVLILSCTKSPVPAPDSPVSPVIEENAVMASPVAAQTNVNLDGLAIEPDWDDGDTFSYKDPETGDRVKARLSGFNTLESYGPVHRWGEWTGEMLYTLAKEAGVRAREGQWTCHKLPGTCGYGRICVACPDLEAALLSEGLAHVFSLKDPADPSMLALQKTAQDAGNGIWSKGVPEELVTSLHSLDEREGQTQTYNRLISTATGASTQLHHEDSYETCAWICPTDSCLRYVPYAQRYGDNQAECLRTETHTD
jgi:micrococcal nuclease